MNCGRRASKQGEDPWGRLVRFSCKSTNKPSARGDELKCDDELIGRTINSGRDDLHSALDARNVRKSLRWNVPSAGEAIIILVKGGSVVELLG